MTATPSKADTRSQRKNRWGVMRIIVCVIASLRLHKQMILINQKTQQSKIALCRFRGRQRQDSDFRGAIHPDWNVDGAQATAYEQRRVALPCGSIDDWKFFGC